jgi:hypothetical protein
MKTIAPLLLALLPFTQVATGQDAPAVAPQDAMARVVLTDEGGQTIWITAASSTNLEYKVVKDSLNRKRVPRSSVEALYFFEPPEFAEALELFKNRDYKGALPKFTAVKEAFKRVDEIKGNYSTLSAFYELECARRAGDLEKLHALVEQYRSGSLEREDFKQQEEIYALWDAIRTKEWTRGATLAADMLEQKKWTSSQLAQIFYCQGLALEGLEKSYAALNAFNGAMTADFTASHELTPQAALACFRIIDGLEEVDLARKLFGTEDENPNSTGHRLLLEAASMCSLWESALGAGQPLPEKYKEFLKYKKK